FLWRGRAPKAEGAILSRRGEQAAIRGKGDVVDLALLVSQGQRLAISQLPPIMPDEITKVFLTGARLIQTEHREHVLASAFGPQFLGMPKVIDISIMSNSTLAFVDSRREFVSSPFHFAQLGEVPGDGTQPDHKHQRASA